MCQKYFRSINRLTVFAILFVVGMLSQAAWTHELIIEKYDHQNIRVRSVGNNNAVLFDSNLQHNSNTAGLNFHFDSTKNDLEIHSYNIHNFSKISTNLNITLSLKGHIQASMNCPNVSIQNFGTLIINGIENRINKLANEFGCVCELKNPTNFNSLINRGKLSVDRGNHNFGHYTNAGNLHIMSGSVHVTYTEIQSQDGKTISNKAYLKVTDNTYGSALKFGRFELAKGGQFDIPNKTQEEQFMQNLKQANSFANNVLIKVNKQILKWENRAFNVRGSWPINHNDFAQQHVPFNKNRDWIVPDHPALTDYNLAIQRSLAEQQTVSHDELKELEEIHVKIAMMESETTNAQENKEEKDIQTATSRSLDTHKQEKPLQQLRANQIQEYEISSRQDKIKDVAQIIAKIEKQVENLEFKIEPDLIAISNHTQAIKYYLKQYNTEYALLPEKLKKRLDPQKSEVKKLKKKIQPTQQEIQSLTAKKEKLQATKQELETELKELQKLLSKI